MFRRIWMLPLILISISMVTLQPQWQARQIEHAFSDQLLSMGADGAIQAGYVQTIHEQRWSDTAFINILQLSLPRDRTEARLRAPITVYYGVRPRNLQVMAFDQGVLKVAVEKVEVLSVDTDLSQMEMETSVGWARLDALSGKNVRTAAKIKFQDSKYQTAGKLLLAEDASTHVLAAINDIATKIPGVATVEIVRRDVVKQPANLQNPHT